MYGQHLILSNTNLESILSLLIYCNLIMFLIIVYSFKLVAKYYKTLRK